MSENTEQQMSLDEARKLLRSLYGENKKITDDSYDKALAVKCINGTFVGKKTDNVIAYRGIPFAGSQPVGDLRWKAPVDVIPDDGVYEAYYNAKSCYGNESLETGSLFYPSEECLYLNVWKADDKSEAKKPVMVWIHGGAYEAGGTVDPEFDCTSLLTENPDVIVVTVAYRLGIFGFFQLSQLPDGKDFPDAQNLGLLDQLKALKWVHENIAAFGGDPDNVTIWGESAGAGSVTLLPLLKGSQGYFKRVIAQSGSPALSRSMDEAIACTNEMMDILGCKTASDFLKVDAQKLFDASKAITLRMGPVRDGNWLPLEPWEAYANGAAKDIDFLLGCNKDEMNFFVVGFGVDNFIKWADGRIAGRLPQLSEDERAHVTGFMEDAKGEAYDSDSRVLSQIWFNSSCIRLSEEQTKAGGRVYTYYFTPEAAVPIMKCGHAIELPVVFNHMDNASDIGRAFDENFTKIMRGMWIRFAKTGNPSLTADISPDGKAYEWPLYDHEDKKVMVLDEFDVHPEKESDRKIVDWERIYPLTKYYWF